MIIGCPIEPHMTVSMLQSRSQTKCLSFQVDQKLSVNVNQVPNDVDSHVPKEMLTTVDVHKCTRTQTRVQVRSQLRFAIANVAFATSESGT